MKLIHTLEEVPLLLGWLVAKGVSAKKKLTGFEEELARTLEERKGELSPFWEERRKEVRKMLKQGKYRPTGRGKPASEYLLRTAREGHFPRINTLVDLGNWLSLKSLLPLSLWDLDRAGGQTYELRLGKAEEEYVFNEAGQTIRLEDLVLLAKVEGGKSTPFANPVKDSLATKTTDSTVSIGVALYAPLSLGEAEVAKYLEELSHWLKQTSPQSQVRWCTVFPSQIGELP